jgi:quinol monooxygenase YgiN
MIVRSAFLEGTVADADRADFDAQLAGPVVDAIRTYPGILDVRLRRLVQADAGSPPVHAVFDLYFADLAAMEAALATPTRQAVRAQIAQVMTRFQGRVYHQVFAQD